jgi:SAM-dependent methyltransferase
MDKDSQQMVIESLEFLASVDNYNHWMSRSIKPYVGHKILELGCGIGSMLQYFLTEKKIFGVDLDPELIDYCKNKFKDHINCEFSAGDIFKDEIKFSEKPDTLVCLNVLEHIEDDRAALNWMSSAVEDNGTLVLLVPSHPGIYGAIDEAAGHHLRYVKEDLITKVEGAGWKVTRSFYFNFIGFFGWWLNSRILKKRHIPIKQTLIYDRYVVPLQAWAEGIVSPPFGQSLIVIAKKTYQPN